ncbi:Adenine phosphoribosyltransferase 1, chloroplastic -like protein [Gossypium arboreum]|uniref:adenine phosphoribosyltransferase n=2 Tax=Gossypium arboreum TaxID=29729 RepID=A0A0B0PS80_GOSAR|nr:Adenine phosphoribosyltransferase 1, chloroplastic -like protein [Gossypium arboreum]
MLQRALIFSSSNPICSQLSTTAPPDNTVFPKRNGGWIIPFSSYQLPAFPSDSAANRPNMASQDEQDPRISNISSAIRVIPDFPKPGIIFQDITTLLLDTKAFRDTIDLFVERYRGKDISVVAGIEARGFIFGPPIALAIGAKFVPMRKPNKLPGEVLSEEYSLEYGKDTMEMHVDAVKAGERALIIDDLVATGGTLSAAISLLERVGVHVVECACVIELPELKGRERLGGKPLFVLVSST